MRVNDHSVALSDERERRSAPSLPGGQQAASVWRCELVGTVTVDLEA